MVIGEEDGDEKKAEGEEGDEDAVDAPLGMNRMLVCGVRVCVCVLVCARVCACACARL